MNMKFNNDQPGLIKFWWKQ